MRTWGAYDPGAKRLAEKYAPGDEDVLQEARLGMLEGMMDVYALNKAGGGGDQDEEDTIVKIQIESRILRLINADKTYEPGRPSKGPGSESPRSCECSVTDTTTRCALRRGGVHSESPGCSP